jgi:hypothetical protein
VNGEGIDGRLLTGDDLVTPADAAQPEPGDAL